MTGYTVHTGTTKKFIQGWDNIFGTKGEGAGRKKSAAKRKKKSNARIASESRKKKGKG